MLLLMLLALFEYAGQISWRIDRNDPPLFPLSNGSHWLLLNPLLYGSLPHPTRNHFEPFAPGKYYGQTSEIVFATENDEVIKAYKSKGPGDDVLLAERLRARLRHLTRQATIPASEALAFSYFEMDRVPASPPLGLAAEGYTVQKYWFVTAVTSEHLRAAASLPLDFIPPTHEVLLLDAIGAHRAGDHRKAVLYAAMSAEVAFGSVIDREYKRVIASHTDTRFRIITLIQAGGKSIHKDPIYERLRGRSDFNVLMHELSLYVLGRSLLTENEVLYQSAKRLYLTRNKLAHLGELPEIDVNQLYTLDHEGALGALATTISLFAWLGERADFPLPEVAFAVAKEIQA